MKSKLWLMVCAVVALLLVLGASGLAATSFTDGDWDYVIADNGSITLKSYHGADAEVVIPDSVVYDGQSYVIRTVAASCFAGNAALQSVTIPARINTIGACAFKNCTMLSHVTILGDLTDCPANSATSDGKGYNDRLTENNALFYNTGTNAASFTVTFGEDVTRIPAYLFATGYARDNNTCAHITRLEIPDSVESIGEYAFYRCYDLKEVVPGDGVVTLGAHCFENCADLPSAPVGSRVATIGGSAFAGCTGMTSATLGRSVTTLGGSAFLGCTRLKDVTLNQGLAKICTSAFQGCSSLETLVIPSSVQTIEACAFKNCTFLSDLTILGDLTDGPANSTTSDGKGYNDRLTENNSVFYNTGTNAASFRS